MELSIGLVLTLVNLVTATLHGYGVKGGATAKAEATAVAGAFGDLGPIPLSIPSGAAYSGSLSKSSASSFASSSASSSSSSYSFSGSGANGLAQIGGSGQKGCTTGSCSGVAPNGPATNGVPQLGDANAVATAQAKALSGVYSPCQGSVCNNSPVEKCSSGQCPTNSEKEYNNECSTGNCQPKTNIKFLSKDAGLFTNCASGQCGKDKQEEDLNDTNDFAVNINQDSRGKSSQDVNGLHYNTQNPSDTSCPNGKCGADNSYPAYRTNKQSQPPAPPIYLTTPNHNEPCTTSNCGPTQGLNPQDSGLPSSYNVPLQSATNPPDAIFSPPGTSYGPENHAHTSKKNDGPCTSPSCKSTLHTTDTQRNQFEQHNPGNQGACVNGQCDYSTSVKPSSNYAVHNIHSPKYSYGGYTANRPSDNLGKPDTFSYQPSQVTPTEPKNTYVPINSKANNCKGTDCSGPSYGGLSPKPSTVDAPVYSGGFGGPAGFLAIGDNKFPVNAPKQHSPSQASTFSTHTGTGLGHSSFVTTQPNDNQPGSYINSNSNSPSGTYGSTLSTVRPTNAYGYNKPYTFSPSSGTQFNPSYANTLGQEPTSNIPSSTVTHPNNYYGVSSSKNHYPSSNNAYPSGSNTGSNTDSGSLRGIYGITNPSGTPNTQSSPTYTSDFGGPAGTSGSSPGTYKPSNTNCGLTGCNGQPSNVNGTPFDKTTSNTPTDTDTKPIYTGGFNRPTGSIDGPSYTSGSTGGYIPHSGNCGSSDCNGQKSFNGNIGSYDTRKPVSAFSSQTTPVFTGGFGGPTGSIDGSSPTGTYKPSFINCGSKNCNGQLNSNSNTNSATFYDTTKTNVPSSSQTNSVNNDGFSRATGALAEKIPAKPTGAYEPDAFNCGLNGCNGQPNPSSNSGTRPYDKTKSGTPNSSQTKPTYTGGFGGPSGFLKPNDYSIPSSLLGNNPCSTGTCGSKGAPASNKNQGNYLTGTQSLAAATVSANAVAYTGGFGGPPGILEAYDNGKVNSPAHGNNGLSSSNYNSQNRESQSANGKDNSPGNSIESGNGVHSAAHASASATASAGNYGGNNVQQNNIGGSGGCNNGCPNNGSNGGGSNTGNYATFNAGSSASAKSVAGANSFGHGRSLASSSASAHATAGAATKGGYGRK